MRSQLVLMIQVWTATAISCGFFIAYGTKKLDSSYSWRLPFILAAIAAGVMAVGIALCPFSPRWLLAQGRREEAEVVVQFLLGSDPEQHEEREELISVGAQGRRNMRDGFVAMFHKGYRGRNALSVFVNVMQQLSGIDFILFYAVRKLLLRVLTLADTVNCSHCCSAKLALIPTPPRSWRQA